MDRNALDWLFSTAPQAIAALVGLIYAGTSFISGKIENAVIADPTLKEISDEFNNSIYKRLYKLLLFSGASIAIDLLFIFLDPIFENECMSFNGTFSWYLTFSILFFILNIVTIIFAIRYIINIMSPDYIDKTVKIMSTKYRNGSVKIETFIQHYINFERILRNYSEKYMDYSNFKKPLTIYQMARDLKDRGIITNEDLINISSINKLRNLILHGGDLNRVESGIDERLTSLTTKISIGIEYLEHD